MKKLRIIIAWKTDGACLRVWIGCSHHVIVRSLVFLKELEVLRNGQKRMTELVILVREFQVQLRRGKVMPQSKQKWRNQ